MTILECQECIKGVEHEFLHGIIGYRYHHCRCEVCFAKGGPKARAYYERNRDAILGRQREYRERNRDAIREQKREYQERNRDAIRDRQHEYYKRNRDVFRARGREYRERNRDAIREWSREYRDVNREEIRECNREYRERNLDYLHRQAKGRREHLKDIPAPRNNSRWTPDEDVVVCRGDLSMIMMSYRLGRSYASVSTRRDRLRRQGVDVDQ